VGWGVSTVDHIRRVLDLPGRYNKFPKPADAPLSPEIEAKVNGAPGVFPIDPNAPTINDSVSLVVEEVELTVEECRALFPEMKLEEGMSMRTNEDGSTEYAAV